MILDWDIHFGNGTMRAFSSDPRVLYISIHRYQNAKFFPCSEEGSHKVTGSGSGEGYTINIPWNKVIRIPIRNSCCINKLNCYLNLKIFDYLLLFRMVWVMLNTFQLCKI